MAEVGVLNLKIQSDTTEAESGLHRLADALGRIKTAVQDAQLNNVASQIRRIVSTVNSEVNDSTISKLKELTDALSKLKGLGDIKINLTNSNRIAKAVESVERAVEAVQAGTRDGVGAGFANAGQSIQGANEDLQEFGMTMNEIDNMVHNSNWAAAFDPAKLPIGALGTKMDKASQEWYQYGAAVRDSYEVVQQMASVNIQRNFDEAEKNLQAMKEAHEETKEIRQVINQDGGEVTVFSSIEEAAEHLGITIDEVKSKLQEAYNIMYGTNDHVPVYSSVEEAAKGLGITTDEVKNKLAETMALINGQANPTLFNSTEEAANRATEAAERTRDKIEQVINTFRNSSQQIKQYVAGLYGFDVSLFDTGIGASASGMVDGINEASPAMQTLSTELDGVKQEADKATESLKETDKEMKKKKKDADDASMGFKDLCKSLASVIPFSGALSKIWKQFKKVALRRTVTAIIKSIWSGLKEGVQNVYEYSKAIGSDFAPAMDSAASSLLQMKNSLGAAVAPLIQALIPILQTVVSWFISLVNYANQFFSLLTGQQQWTRAVPATATAFNNQTKAAKGAANAVKDLLADWDELNIIQSETSSGAGGGVASAAEDYLNMFEQVGEFDNRVRKAVDFLKDNFERIKKIAFEVLAAISAWKFSKAFTGVLSTLGGIIASGLIAKLVFDVSTVFTNQYLETGDVGWLVGDVLETFVGSVFAKGILDTVLKGNAGDIAIPLIFGISAAATIIANVEHTDVDAFSEKGLLTELTAALEGGVAAGYLAHMIGGTLGESILGGVVGTIATFGIAVGLKADAKVSAEGITPDAVKQKLVAIGSLGIAGAITGAKVAASTGVAVGAGAAGMAMLFMGVPVATFGVSVGLHAINETVEAKSITPEVIRDNFLSAALVGAGLAIGTIAVAGASVAGIVGVAGAAVTVAALFGIEAVIAEDHVSVAWGNYEATEQQVKDFVSGIFDITPDAIFTIIDPLIDVVSTSEEGLKANVGEVKLAAKKVTLGIGNKMEALKQLNAQIFGDEENGTKGLIAQFRETAKEKQNLIETSFTLVPMTKDDGTTADIINESSDVWTKLTEHMEDLGRELSGHLSKAYSEDIDEETRKMELDTVAKLTQMMTNIAEAITEGESWADAIQDLEDNINNLSKGSYDKIFDYIKEYKESVTKAYTTAYDQGTREMSGQVRALKERMNNALELANGNEEDATYLLYKSEYEYWRDQLLARKAGRDDAIKAATNDAMDEDTIDIIRQSILSKIEGLPNQLDFKNAFLLAGIDTGMDGSVDEFFRGLFDENGYAKAGAKTKYEAFISGLIETMFGEDADTIQKLIDLEIIDIADFIPKELIEQLSTSLLQNSDDSAVREAMLKFLGGDFKESEIKQVTQPAVDVAETIKQRYIDALNNGDSREIERTLAELVGTYGNEEVERIVEEVDASISVTVDNVKVEDPKQIQRDIQSIIRDAYDQGLDSNQFDLLIHELIGKHGTEAVEEALDAVERESQFGTSGKYRTLGLIAAGGVSDMGMGRKFVTTGNAAATTNTEPDISGEVAKGTREGNVDQNSLLYQLVNICRQIANKDFTVNVNPTSSWGGFNKRAAQAWSRVTGEEEQ